jgi:hypothetical protein
MRVKLTADYDALESGELLIMDRALGVTISPIFSRAIHLGNMRER